MDMTREALQYVVGLNKPEIINIDGASYTDKELVRVQNELRAAPLKWLRLQVLWITLRQRWMQWRISCLYMS